jgi:probable rRNA maturation factor
MSDGPSTERGRPVERPEVFVADEQSDVAVDVRHLAALATDVLVDHRVRANAELSLFFVDAEVMADLNDRYMGEQGPTDVLAFPIDEDTESGRSPDAGTPGPDRGPVDTSDIPLLLGDVFVCPAVAQRNAAERSIAVEDEVALLVVHGVLHVLGMDHAAEGEAAAMQARERDLLARFHRRSEP